MIRIIIADDHTVVREGMKLMLNHQKDIEVIGIAPDGQSAYEMVGELKPDIILLDISMPPGESCVVTAGRIHQDYPNTRIIIMTMYAEKEYLLYTVQIGVAGYVLKNAQESEILEAIYTVRDGGNYVSKDMLPYLVQGFVNRNREEEAYLQLSEREMEILTLIAKGYGNKEISEKLFISVKTVESYKSKIMNKLNLKSRPELVEYAVKKKLIQYE